MVKDASQYREVYRTCAEFGRPDGKSTIPAGASRSAVNKIKRVEFPADPLNGHATHDHADRIHSWPQPQWTIQNVAAPQPQAPAQCSAYATQQYWAHHTEAPTVQQPQQHTYYAYNVDASSMAPQWSHAHGNAAGPPASIGITPQSSAAQHPQRNATSYGNGRERKSYACFTCRQEGHFARDCPERQRRGNRRDSMPTRNSLSPGREETHSRNGWTQDKIDQKQHDGSRQWPTASSGTQQQNQETRQSEGQLEYQVRATHLPATSCNVPSASKPIDPKLVEIIADIKLEGVDVSATFDTGSPVTVIRESLWVKVAQNGVQLHPARLRMS